MSDIDEGLRKRAFDRLEKLLDTLDVERAHLIKARSAFEPHVRQRESDNKALETHVKTTGLIASALAMLSMGVTIPQSAWDLIGKDEDDE